MRKGGPPKKKKNKKVHRNKYAHLANSLGEKELENYELLVDNISSCGGLEVEDFYSDFRRIKDNPTKENYHKLKSYYHKIKNSDQKNRRDLSSLL